MTEPATATASLPGDIVASGTRYVVRRARAEDLPAIVALLADDPLGAARESATTPLPAGYVAAFAAIDADPNHELVVVQGEAHPIAGVLQLTFLPGISHRGGCRAQVEGVRIAAPLRSGGLGGALFAWAIGRARARGCLLVQLTTDKARPAAFRFYESLGFEASHEGMKLAL